MLSGRSHPVRVDPKKSLSLVVSTTTPASSGSLSSSSSSVNSSKSGRRVTPEQRRLLQAKAAQRSKSRQDQSSPGVGAKAASVRDSILGREELGVDVNDGSIEIGEDATSAMAFQSLNHISSPESVSPSYRYQLRTGVNRSGDASNGSLEIPMEDLSLKGRQRHNSDENIKANTMAPKSIFRFQRSLSHSPSRSSSSQQDASTSLILANKVEVARRLSAPVTLDSTKKNPVTKVCTASPLSRPTSHSSPQSSNLPVRRRCLSSPATLKTEPTQPLSLVCHPVDPNSILVIPKLLPPADPLTAGTGNSQSKEASGARPKQYSSTRTEIKAPSSGGGGLTAHKLNLHGLQQAEEERKLGGGREAANSAISPETPSSDSAVSSDASMISVSSLASESSMDVDSDNNMPIMTAAAVGGKPASASQQLTQLAQMVQEHYPYKDPKHHTG